MVAALLAACAAPAAPGAGQQGTTVPGATAVTPQATAPPVATEDEGPFRIEVLLRYHTPDAPRADNLVIQEFERLANVELDLTWTPQTAYEDVINVIIASGDLPMVMLITGNVRPMASEVDAVRNGMFWRLQDFMEPFYYLNQVSPVSMANASIDGYMWGMFRTRPLIRSGFIFRQDWFDALDLDFPRNAEHLMEILEVLRDADIDGIHAAGQAPMLLQDDIPIRSMGAYFGVPNEWGIVDGRLVPDHFYDEYLETLQWFRTAYERGLINRDFPSLQTNMQRDAVGQGRGLFMFHSIDRYLAQVHELRNIVPDAEFTPGVVFSEAPHMMVHARSGWDGKFYVSTSAVPDEADVWRIMEFFDFMHSPAANNLIQFGIEDRHHTMVSEGMASQSAEQRELFASEVLVIEQFGFRFNLNNHQVYGMPAYEQRINELFTFYDHLALGNPTAAFVADSFNRHGRELEDLIDSANIRFVIGEIDEAGWMAVARDEWLRLGGQAIMDEYQAMFDAIN